MQLAGTKKHPTILWAQRDNLLLLTVKVEDMKIDELVVDKNKFYSRGTNSGAEENYEADFELYAAVKGDERRQIATARQVELVIPKEKAEWWPRLLNKPMKAPWLKVDFDKWIEEDEEVGEQEGVDKFFQQIYKNLDEDGRRAMAKSYAESAGTVLSTNWKDVGGKKVEVKPPDGMEYKQYQT